MRPALATVLAASGLVAGPAGAQALGQLVYGQILDSEIPLSVVTGRNQGVRDRAKPELEPVGLPLGTFRLLPTARGGLGYTTNALGAERGGRADGYVEVNPGLVVRSDWQRHALGANFYYDGLRFFNTAAKNQNGFLAQVNGRLDVATQDSVTASASFRRFYEDQQEASFPLGGAGAVAVDQPGALVRGVYQANRARLTASLDYNGFTYRNTRSTNGTLLDLGYRDRDVYRASGRAEYLLGQDNSVFLQGTYRRTDYQATDAPNDRTSNEWRLSAGAIADVTQLLRVAGAVGYFRRTYPNPVFRPIASVAADVRVAYYLTPLTTVTALVSREPVEAPLTGSSGFLETRGGLRVDHELLRNLILYASGNYSRASFRGVDRRDRIGDIGAGVEYAVNRLLTLRFSNAYVQRTSSGTQRGPDIKEVRGLLSLTYHP